MEINTLSIEINKPVEVVFDMALNPINTPKWIPEIFEEKVLDEKIDV